MRISDWSSDVCSSDLEVAARPIEQDMVGHADRVGGAVARQAVHRLARDLAGKLLVQRLRLLGRQPRRAGFGAARGRTDRKSVVEGKSVSVRVDLGGRRIIKKKIQEIEK